MIRILESTPDFQKHISENSLLLADFYADWCEPCKWLDKILDEVSETIDFPVTILKINTDKHLELTHQFHLRSVPVLMIFKEGILKWKMNGFMTAPELIEKMKVISRET